MREYHRLTWRQLNSRIRRRRAVKTVAAVAIRVVTVVILAVTCVVSMAVFD